MRKISIYGKGGVGKSTVASNLTACLQHQGYSTALIGCSPKADSTYLLMGQLCHPTILDSIKTQGPVSAAVQSCIRTDSRGIRCIETGGPEPAAGCAGRGVSHSLQLLSRFQILENLNVQMAIYDVIADVVCGGFAEPMRKSREAEVYIVTSGEMMSLYAANNICNAVVAIHKQTGNDLRVAGLILNLRGLHREQELVEQFASIIQVPVIASIPRSPLVQLSETEKRLVIETHPNSDISESFYRLAKQVVEPQGVMPVPMTTSQSIETIQVLIRSYGEEYVDSQPATRTSYKAHQTKKEHQDNIVERRYTESQQLRRIAVYGKAGIGKSVTSSNLSAALSELGEQVMQIGCDPKRDSVALLAHQMIPTILEQQNRIVAKGSGDLLSLEEVVFSGFNQTYCVESGGPTAGMGCAGQGVFSALEFLEASNAYQRYKVSFAMFDILGDVVCGGFAQPIRGGFCREVYVVVNGEPLSLVVTNNILRAMRRMYDEGIPVGVAGIINNQRGVANEIEIVETFAIATGVPVIAHIPRSTDIQRSEAQGKTLMEAYPNSTQAEIYRQLARKILNNRRLYTPQPIKEIDQIYQLISPVR